MFDGVSSNFYKVMTFFLEQNPGSFITSIGSVPTIVVFGGRRWFSFEIGVLLQVTGRKQ